MKTSIEWCDLITIPVNKRMATLTHGTNIQPMFPEIAKMVMVNLCLPATAKARQLRGYYQLALYNCIGNSILGCGFRLCACMEIDALLSHLDMTTIKAFGIQPIASVRILTKTVSWSPCATSRTPLKSLLQISEVFS